MFPTNRRCLLSCAIYLAIIGIGITSFTVEAAGIVGHHAVPSLAAGTAGESVPDDALDTGDTGRRVIVKVPHGGRGERVERALRVKEEKRGEKWCNQYFCLTATISFDAATESKDTSKTNETMTQITYSLVSRSEEGALGWLAVGAGHQMMGGKMWVTWPDQAEGGGRGCVLSERDGTGYKPPTITKDPIAHLVPNLIKTGASNTTATRPFECTWTVPTSKFAYFEGGSAGVESRATPMDMMWAFSGARPVPVQGDPSKDGSGAGIKMHSAFGTFAVDFNKRFGEEGGAEDADDAGAKDEAKEAKRRMVIRAHAVVMTIAWIVTAPVAVVCARYGRGAFKWVPYHQYIQIGGTAPLSLVGFFLAVASVVMRGGKSFQGAHEILGLLLFLLLLLQGVSGLWIHHLYNPDRTHRPPRNYFHMAAGITLLVGGFVEVQLGIRKWGSPGWMVISYWVWTGLLAALFVIGYALLPRQMRQEKEEAKQRNLNTRLSRIQVPFSDRENKSKISPFPSANSPSPGEGSASKSRIKYPWHSRRAGENDLGDVPMLEYSSNEMEAPSVPPPNSRTSRVVNGGDASRRGRGHGWM